MAAAAIAVMADKLADMEQGAEFTKCIKLDDWTTKTLDDDITLMAKDANGCCPEGSVPGAKLYTQYQGAQVVCGVKDDGSIGSFSSSSSNGNKTCNYQKCYMFKQGLTCKDDTKQRLNGCCGAKPQTNFKDLCKFYDKSHSSVTAGASATNAYCLSYHKNYGTVGNKGTSAKTDDLSSGKFQVDKFYSYAPCDGASGGSSPSPSPSPATTKASTSYAGSLAASFAALAPMVAWQVMVM